MNKLTTQTNTLKGSVPTSLEEIHSKQTKHFRSTTSSCKICVQQHTKYLSYRGKYILYPSWNGERSDF